MATTLKQDEAIPASYASITAYEHRPFEFPAEDATIEPALIWQRIEAYIAHRYTARAVVWTVEGPGDWEPPLVPATISATECWTEGTGWSAVTLDASFLGGYVLASDGPYRITASVGGGDVPEAVQEAYKRLFEYSRGVAEQWRGDAGHRQYGDTEFVANWTGKAIQLSGAADLLRPYRRA